jgi:hypothetical protein
MLRDECEECSALSANRFQRPADLSIRLFNQETRFIRVFDGMVLLHDITLAIHEFSVILDCGWSAKPPTTFDISLFNRLKFSEDSLEKMPKHDFVNHSFISRLIMNEMICPWMPFDSQRIHPSAWRSIPFHPAEA